MVHCAAGLQEAWYWIEQACGWSRGRVDHAEIEAQARSRHRLLQQVALDC